MWGGLGIRSPLSPSSHQLASAHASRVSKGTGGAFMVKTGAFGTRPDSHLNRVVAAILSTLRMHGPLPNGKELASVEETGRMGVDTDVEQPIYPQGREGLYGIPVIQYSHPRFPAVFVPCGRFSLGSAPTLSAHVGMCSKGIVLPVMALHTCAHAECAVSPVNS
ncbi:hypothetical protein VTO73DRAFT_4307 [Trametes versicolor]